MSSANPLDRTARSLGPSDTPQPDAVLRCKTDHTRLITRLLSAICIKDKQQILSGPLAWCELSKEGIRFWTQDTQSIMATTHLDKAFFREYAYDDDERIAFSINLGVVLECLRVLDGSRGSMLSQPPSLHMRFVEEKASLCLMLAEGSAITNCEIATVDGGSEPPVTAGTSERWSARVVMSADRLRDSLQELEWGDPNQKDKVVTLAVSSAARELRLTVRNADCGCEINFPSSALVSMEAENDASEQFRFTHLQAVSRALAGLEQVCLRVMNDGMLRAQLRYNDGSQAGFIEYHIAPLEQEDPFEPFQ